MNKFEEKVNAVLEYVDIHFQEDNPYLEKDVTLSDINNLLKSVMTKPLYYIDEWSNDVETSKYKLHTDYVDYLTQMMNLVVGEFSFTFSDLTTTIAGEIKEQIQEIYRKNPHTALLQTDVKMHTVVKTEIDQYFYDDIYKTNEIVHTFLRRDCYSQIALIKLILRYAGFFNAVGVLDRVLAAVKVVLTTPMAFEYFVGAIPTHIKNQIEQFFGWMVTDEVAKKYKEAAKEKNKEKKEHKFNFKLYNVVRTDSPSNPVLIAATDVQNAYDTFVKEFVEDGTDPKLLVDGVIKVSECLTLSDEVYDFVEEKIINKPPVKYVKPRGPFSFLYEMFEPIDMTKENEDFVI